MVQRVECWAVLLVPVILVVACTSPQGTNQTQPSNVNEMATTVAMTLQALAPQVTKTPRGVSGTATNLLPQSLYFLGNDSQATLQVFRIERDGKTRTQLTSEPVSVDGYDVSPADGSLAFVANGQLLLAETDGSNRRVLVDGGYQPVFSPDGKTLAYGRNGLNLYNVATGTSRLVIQDQVGAPLPNGAPFPIEGYSPERYSPDGTKLLLALSHWEALPSHAVYYPDGDNLVRYAEVEEYLYCCSFYGGPAWSPDSSAFYGIASAHDYSFAQGALWRVDAGTGTITTIIPAGEDSGQLNVPKEVFAARDGGLYFFLGKYSENRGFFDAPILEMVRVRAGAGTNRTILRSENFRLMNEALWAPDGSFAIVATLPERRWEQGGGVLELYPTDRRKEAVWLAPFGKQLKWGP